MKLENQMLTSNSVALVGAYAAPPRPLITQLGLGITLQMQSNWIQKSFPRYPY